MECFKNLNTASQYLAGLQNEKRKIEQTAEALRQEFASTHQNAPVKLIKAKGRGLVWRLNARQPQKQSILRLTGEQGQHFLQQLSPLFVASLLAFEQRRMTLTSEQRILSYQIRLISEWMAVQRLVHKLKQEQTKKSAGRI